MVAAEAPRLTRMQTDARRKHTGVCILEQMTGTQITSRYCLHRLRYMFRELNYLRRRTAQTASRNKTASQICNYQFSTTTNITKTDNAASVKSSSLFVTSVRFIKRRQLPPVAVFVHKGIQVTYI